MNAAAFLRIFARHATVLAVALSLTGCQRFFQNSQPGALWGNGAGDGAPALQPGMGVESSVLPEPVRGAAAANAQEVPQLRRIYFGFDSAEVLEPAKAPLDENANWLRSNPGVQVQIEGHCDVRGTSEYNYALGQSRADAVRNYLMGRGVESGRLHTISYGAEQPANPSDDERAWAENRRAVFKLYAR